MHELANRLSDWPVTADRSWTREFEARLVDSAALAFRVAFSVLRQREDAEDVAQEAFARAHRRFGDLRDRDRFRAWLARMTWRLALDRRKADRRRMAREERAARERPEAAPVDLERQALTQERSARLWSAIDRLPEKLRLVVVLSAIQGHGVRDVAVLLDIAEGTVKSRLFEARKKLQEWLR